MNKNHARNFFGGGSMIVAPTCRLILVLFREAIADLQLIPEMHKYARKRTKRRRRIMLRFRRRLAMTLVSLLEMVEVALCRIEGKANGIFSQKRFRLWLGLDELGRQIYEFLEKLSSVGFGAIFRLEVDNFQQLFERFNSFLKPAH